jgi:small subunit ribosomal protein S20
MAHHPSAIRQHRRSLRRRAVNKRNLSRLRSEVKSLRDLIEKKDKDAAQKILPKVVSAIDNTVRKGTVHPNKGARTKSRLSRQVAAINSAPKP